MNTTARCVVSGSEVMFIIVLVSVVATFCSSFSQRANVGNVVLPYVRIFEAKHTWLAKLSLLFARLSLNAYGTHSRHKPPRVTLAGGGNAKLGDLAGGRRSIGRVDRPGR